MLSTWRRPLALAAFLLVVVVGYFTATNTYNGDGFLSFHTGYSIVHSGDLYLDEVEQQAAGSYGLVPAPDGHVVDRYPWMMGLVAVPSVLALDAAHAVGVGPGSLGAIERGGAMNYIQMANGALATLVAVAVVTITAFALVEGEERHRRLVALVVGAGFAFGTTAWSMASRANWQHGASMALTSIAVLSATRLDAGRRAGWALLLGVGVGAAYTVRPTNMSIVVALGLWVLLVHLRRAPLAILGAMAVVGPWMAINQATYGQRIAPYHDSSQASLEGNLTERLATQIFSPTRGLLLFSPIVVLAVLGWWRAMRRPRGPERLHPGLALALAAAASAHLLAVASQPFVWWAGVGFGPRFMTDALPWLAVLAVPAVAMLLGRSPTGERSSAQRVGLALAGAALIWSVVVHAQGAYMRSTICWNFSPDIDETQVWAWSNSQLFAGIGSFGEAPVGSLFTEPCSDLPDT